MSASDTTDLTGLSPDIAQRVIDRLQEQWYESWFRTQHDAPGYQSGFYFVGWVDDAWLYLTETLVAEDPDERILPWHGEMEEWTWHEDVLWPFAVRLYDEIVDDLRSEAQVEYRKGPGHDRAAQYRVPEAAL